MACVTAARRALWWLHARRARLAPRLPPATAVGYRAAYRALPLVMSRLSPVRAVCTRACITRTALLARTARRGADQLALIR